MPNNDNKKVTVATRGSMLALWQAEWVKSELEGHNPGLTVELLKIKTTGDKITDVPLAQVGGKGLFTKEIEEALLEERAELAVHSMKDVPTESQKGLHLAAITEREDPRDALISHDGTLLADLPEGAVIGTSSLRRKAQLLKLRPDLVIKDLRGNVDTRLRKVSEGQYAAIILAGAGLRRLGFDDRITEYIDPTIMLPAIGQGALGIETRIADESTNALVKIFDHRPTSVSVRAERGFLKRLEGGCQVPIAAFATLDGETVTLKGLVASVDGTTFVEGELSGSADNAEAVGVELAEKLLSEGAYDILKELYDVKPAT